MRGLCVRGCVCLHCMCALCGSNVYTCVAGCSTCVYVRVCACVFADVAE